MKKEIQDDLEFLISEFKRLKKKKEEKSLAENEKETCDKLIAFFEQNKE